MGQRVGQAMDEGDELMRSAPSRVIEKILPLLIPPACREEVLGDLYEGCDTAAQYVREVLRIAPMVLFSRIRRTADSQVLLMLASPSICRFYTQLGMREKCFSWKIPVY